MSSKYKILDLFSGLGGFSLGLERTGHFETVAFCDNDKFSKLILDKHWKGIKVYEDVREITKEKFKQDGTPFPDIITGGFPCQPFSVAGKQKGTSDDRHLWPEMFRIIKAFKPRYVIGENVRGIVNIQDGVVFETVCTDLESEGYEVQPFIIPAASVGAPHRRERVWIIANREESMVNPDDVRLEQHNETEKTTSWRGTSATFKSTSSTNVANTIGNDERQEISRSDEETRRIQEEHRTEHSATRQSSRTSEVWNGDNGYESMENSNNNGLEGRLSETRNETITRKELTINGSEDTDNSSRRSDGRGDQSQPRVDGTIQGLRDGNEEEFTRAARVRGLHERADNSHNFSRENGTQENDSRALVQERQGGVQSSEHRGLGENQTSLKNNQVRQRDDNATLDRVENGHEDVANSRRALWSRGQLSEKNENEVGEKNADQLERSSSASRFNVADTESIESNVGGLGQHQGERSGQGEIGGASSEDDANSNEEGLQGFRQSRNQLNKRFSLRSESSEGQQGSVDQGWWSVEPNVGRVAHGVSGRVHRLKGLGNSIVPQIVEEIGKALIKAERTK